MTNEEVLVLGLVLALGIGAGLLLLWWHGYVGSPETQLLRAAHAGNWNRFVKVLPKCPDVNVRDRYGRTPLILACYQADASVVKALIQQGADVNLADGNGLSTPLHRAAYAGNAEVAEVLIKEGADVDGRDGALRTPLAGACASYQRTDPRVLSVLLQAGSDPNVPDRDGWAPLHLLLMNVTPPRLAEVRMLLQFDADPAVRNPHPVCRDSSPFGRPPTPFGETPYEIAMNGGYMEIAKMLQAAMETTPDKGDDPHPLEMGSTEGQQKGR
jgi:ankyrin repeat protein